MKEYNVHVIVKYYSNETIEAKSKKEAIKIAEQMYYDGCFDELQADGFYPAKISCWRIEEDV